MSNKASYWYELVDTIIV